MSVHVPMTELQYTYVSTSCGAPLQMTSPSCKAVVILQIPICLSVCLCCLLSRCRCLASILVACAVVCCRAVDALRASNACLSVCLPFSRGAPTEPLPSALPALPAQFSSPSPIPVFAPFLFLCSCILVPVFLFLYSCPCIPVLVFLFLGCLSWVFLLLGSLSWSFKAVELIFTQIP